MNQENKPGLWWGGMVVGLLWLVVQEVLVYVVRGPSFCNLAVLEDIMPGTFLADAVAIIGATDVVIGETDR